MMKNFNDSPCAISKMQTYQDLEAEATERKIEYDAIFNQIDNMEKTIIEMQAAIVNLKHYLKGSIYFDTGEL